MNKKQRLHRGVCRDTETGDYLVTDEYKSGWVELARFATRAKAFKFLAALKHDTSGARYREKLARSKSARWAAK